MELCGLDEHTTNIIHNFVTERFNWVLQIINIKTENIFIFIFMPGAFRYNTTSQQHFIYAGNIVLREALILYGSEASR